MKWLGTKRSYIKYILKELKRVQSEPLNDWRCVWCNKFDKQCKCHN